MPNKIVLYYPWVGYMLRQHSEHRIPYSLLDLIEPLKSAGFEVVLLDGRFTEDKHKFLVEIEDKPLFVGISSMTGIQLVDAANMAKWVKQSHPEIPIVWGGWHVSILPEQSLEEPFVDAVVVGQGEQTIVEVAQALGDERDLYGIQGLIYKDNGKTKKNAERSLSDNYHKIDFSAIDLNRYTPYLGYLTSHGCPLDCTFCAIARIYHRKFFMRPMDDTIHDLKYVLDRYPAYGQINLDDDNFFINQARVEEFCDKWNNYKNLPIATLAHVRELNKYPDELWKKMVKSGLSIFLIGAESGNKTILERLKKHQTVDDMLQFVEKTAKYHVMADLSLITGFPDSEELQDFKDTIQFLMEAWKINPAVKFKLFWIRPYAGTELFLDFQKRGIRMPTNMREWSYYTLRNRPSWVNKELELQIAFFVTYFLPMKGYCRNGTWDVSKPPHFTWNEFMDEYNKHRGDSFLTPITGLI